MKNFINDLALAHQRHEGYYPNTIAYRRNNPGNLRGKDGHFIHFTTYGEGFAALKYDLSAKIFGTAGSIQRFIKASWRSYDQLVFQDYVSIYAPSADFNNPVRYCDALCRDLEKYNVQPSTPLKTLAQLVRGEIERVHDPVPLMPHDKRLQSAKNALKWATPLREKMLLRLINRLERLLKKQEEV